MNNIDEVYIGTLESYDMHSISMKVFLCNKDCKIDSMQHCQLYLLHDFCGKGFLGAMRYASSKDVNCIHTWGKNEQECVLIKMTNDEFLFDKLENIKLYYGATINANDSSFIKVKLVGFNDKYKDIDIIGSQDNRSEIFKLVADILNN